MTSTVIYEGNLRTVGTHLSSGSTIETDAPLDNNGKGERFSPTDLVATALASCMLTIMGMKARDMHIDLAGVTTDVTKIMVPDPRRIGGIKVVFHFPEPLLSSLSDKDKTILERAALTCPVHKSLHPDMEIDIDFGWKQHTGE
jgi:putative redox protein